MISIKEFPELDDMLALPEVLKEIENDILEIEMSGTYNPKQKRKLDAELDAVQNRLAAFYN